MRVAIEDNSITLMSLVTTCQLGRTLSRRTCSEIVLALLLLCLSCFSLKLSARWLLAATSMSMSVSASKRKMENED
jgi:hypothetical protein